MLRNNSWPGKHKCMEDVRSWQENISMYNFWYSKERWSRCNWPTCKQSILLPVFDIVWAVNLWFCLFYSVNLWFCLFYLYLFMYFLICTRGLSDKLRRPCCSYQHSDGNMRLRATTLSRKWVAGPGSNQASFHFVFLLFCFSLLMFYMSVFISCLPLNSSISLVI